MPRDWRTRLADMLKAIEQIERLARPDQKDSEMMGLALERAFEILSEASRHLPSHVKTRFPAIRWQDLADLGNIIRHAYDRVSLERLRATADRDIPPLKAVLLDIGQGDAS